MTNQTPFKRLLSLVLVLLTLISALPVPAEEASPSDEKLPTCTLSPDNEGKYQCYRDETSETLKLDYSSAYEFETILIVLKDGLRIPVWQTAIIKKNLHPARGESVSFTIDTKGLGTGPYFLWIYVVYYNGTKWVQTPFTDLHVFHINMYPWEEPDPDDNLVKVKSFKLKLGKKFIAGKTVKLKKGKSVTVRATDFQPAGASNIKLKWRSTNTRVAVVSPKGKVVARRVGTCKIVAKTTDGSRIARSFILKVVE